MSGEVFQSIIRENIVKIFDLISEDSNPSFKIGWSNILSKPPFKARDQTFFQIIKMIWTTVAGQHNLLVISVKCIETVEVFFANNQLLFRSENISFYTRLLEGNYPDTDRLIPTDFSSVVTFNTNNLRHAMERSRLLSNATQNGTVKLEIVKGIVSAHVHSPEVGRVNEEIDTESVSGEDLTISFNPTYLIEALKAVDSEQVTISFISAVRPFTLVPSEDAENFIQLITPVRTN